MAFLFAKLDGFELKYNNMTFSTDLKIEDVLYDEKQIKFNERMMKTSLMAMRIEQDFNLEYYNLVRKELTEEGFEDPSEILKVL